MAELSKKEAKVREDFKREVMAAVTLMYGWNHKDLAARIGCTQCQLSQFFSGKMDNTGNTDFVLDIALKCAKVAKLKGWRKKAYASVGRIAPW